jgi:hypothetical protein
MKFHCQYYKEGGEYICTAQFIKSHEANCPHRPFNCPFSVAVTKKLCWKGHIWHMSDHISYKHKLFTLPEEGEFVFKLDCPQPGPLHRAFYALDETFFMVCRVINTDLYCCFLYVGPEEWASRYKYSMTIKTMDGSGYATVCLPTPSYFVDVETLFRKRECAVFSHLVLDRCRCVFSKQVSFEVKIGSLIMPAFKTPK